VERESARAEPWTVEKQATHDCEGREEDHGERQAEWADDLCAGPRGRRGSRVCRGDDRQSLGADQRRGRFYKIGDNQLLFMGYFQGNVEVEGQRGDLHGAGMVCPGLMEVDRTTRTQQGEGRCIIATSGGDFLYAGWACTGKPGEGCGGLFTITGGTGKFSKASGLSLFWMRSTVAEVVTTVPEKDVTATFTGQALWEALKYTMP
jgi:hypothetical protein